MRKTGDYYDNTVEFSFNNRKRREICDLAQQELKNRCRNFENKYTLISDEFYKLFQE